MSEEEFPQKFGVAGNLHFNGLAAAMILEISEEERNLLLELIGGAEDAAIQSMDHADSRSFQGVLKTKLELLASVKEKLSGQGILVT